MASLALASDTQATYVRDESRASGHLRDESRASGHPRDESRASGHPRDESRGGYVREVRLERWDRRPFYVVDCPFRVDVPFDMSECVIAALRQAQSEGHRR